MVSKSHAGVASQSMPSSESEKKKVESGSVRSFEATPLRLKRLVREVRAAMKLPGTERKGKNRMIGRDACCNTLFRTDEEDEESIYV